MIRKYAGLVVLAAVFCCMMIFLYGCAGSGERVVIAGTVKEVRVVTIDEVCACTVFIDVQGQEEVITWVAQSLPTSFLTSPSYYNEAVRMQVRRCALLAAGDQVEMSQWQSVDCNSFWSHCRSELWKIELKSRADEG